MPEQCDKVKITAEKLGKRYNREWIFKNFNYTFTSGTSYAITGPNGSGKSTLLQVLAGAVLNSQGTIEFDINEKKDENFYKHLAIAAPYLELIEELTALEFLKFHSAFSSFKKLHEEILEEVSLQNAANKQIRYYSSGMKQRLKLAQAFYSTAPVLLLDEPTTNLDEAGVNCYNDLIAKYSKEKLVIVCSNDRREFQFCEQVIAIEDYKKFEV